MIVGASEVRTVVLFLPKEKEMYPMSTSALTCAQGSRRRIMRDHQDALILDHDGMRKIDSIRILGLMGDSFNQKLMSLILNTWRIEVRLSSLLPYTLEQIKQIMIDCSESITSIEEWNGENVDKQFSLLIKEVVEHASNIEEIFALMMLPPPEGALDILCTKMGIK
jgi:hypothetical protein